MVSDKKPFEPKDSVHILMALRRKKENRDAKGELCFRQVVRDIDVDYDILKTRIKNHDGFWRIYHTFNTRSVEKARRLVLKELIDYPEKAYKVDSLWKSCLLKPACRAEKNIMIDVDVKFKTEEERINYLSGMWTILIGNCEISHDTVIRVFNSPNGVHLVLPHFNTRYFYENLTEEIEIKHDGFRSFGWIEVKDGKIYNIGFEIDLFVDKQFPQSQIIAEVASVVTKYMDIDAWEMGQNIYLAQLVEQTNNVAGVLNVIDLRVYNKVGQGKYSSN